MEIVSLRQFESTDATHKKRLTCLAGSAPQRGTTIWIKSTPHGRPSRKLKFVLEDQAARAFYAMLKEVYGTCDT